MREEVIIVRPFQFIDYMEIKGHQCVGGHGTFKIRGHVAPENEKEYLGLIQSETWVEVAAADYAGIKQPIFNGIILNADIERISSTCILTLELITGSYLMDRIPHIRSFQNSDMQYGAVVHTIMNGYEDGRYRMTTAKGQPIQGFLLQYQETDWAFARRMASRFGTDIFTSSVYYGITLHFGEPELAISTEINTGEYAMVKRPDGTYGYKVTLRELVHVGDWLQFNGHTVWVAETDTELVKEELYHTCYLLWGRAVPIVKKYNSRCAGVSLTGKVTAVEKDSIQMEIDKDENREDAGRCWFPYATPYSDSDGAGWYCMPEIGDSVRLHIPTEDEATAYAVNSVHIKSNGTERQNPAYKSFMNKQGKEILMTPDSLIMTNNAGMSIEILDREGVRIISNKNILLEAEEDIEITSANSRLQLLANEEISLRQGDTQMCMDGGMRIDGARLNLN